MDDSRTWYNLKEAAARLGIHENTLRRWADEGRIRHMVTLGGHRRFAANDVDALLNSRVRQAAVPGLADIWLEAALAHTRQELVVHGDADWVTTFDKSQRMEKRELGRKLMALVLQYVSQDQNGAAILSEASSVGVDYARMALAVGMPLSTVLQAVMFFREMLLETVLDLPDSVNARPQDQKRLVGRVSELLNAVELAVVQTYEQTGS
jgi:excisionase family DNA binding protein